MSIPNHAILATIHRDSRNGMPYEPGNDFTHSPNRVTIEVAATIHDGSWVNCWAKVLPTHWLTWAVKGKDLIVFSDGTVLLTELERADALGHWRQSEAAKGIVPKKAA